MFRAHPIARAQVTSRRCLGRRPIADTPKIRRRHRHISHYGAVVAEGHEVMDEPKCFAAMLENRGPAARVSGA